MISNHRHSGAEKIATELGTFYICNECGQKFVSWRRKLSNLYIAQRFYQSRGNSYSAAINGLFNAIQSGGMILLLIKATTGSMPPMSIIPLMWLVQSVIETIIGYKDYTKWKVGQNESIFGLKYSPSGVETMERLYDIDKILCEMNGKEFKKESVLEDYYKTVKVK